MDIFDSNMKDYFSNQASDVPEGYDWEDMKASIFDKMEAAPEQPKPNNWRKYLWLLFIGCFLLVIANLSGLFQSTDTPVATERMAEEISKENATLTETISTDNYPTSESTKTAVKSTTATTSTINEQKETTSPATPSTKQTTSQNNQLASAPSTLQNQSANQQTNKQENTNTFDTRKDQNKQQLSIADVSTNRISKQGTAKSIEAGKEGSEERENKTGRSTTQQESMTSTTQPIAEVIKNRVRTSISVSPLLPQNNLLAQLPIVTADQQLPKPSFEVPKNKRPALYLLLSSGINYWQASYNGNTPLVDLKNNTSSKGIGQYFTGAITLKWSNDFYLKTGLSFNNLEDQFNHITQRDSLFLEENALVEIHTNRLTGVKTNIYRDTMVPGVISRRVQHYNYTKLWSFHLSGGKEWQFNRWKVMTDIGGAFQYIKVKEGRTIDEAEQIRSFDQNTTIYQNSSLALSAGLGFYYQLSPQVAIGAQASFTQAIGNWSNTKDLSLRPGIYNIGIGLQRASLRMVKG